MHRRVFWLAAGLLAVGIVGPSAAAQQPPIAFEGTGPISVDPNGSATTTLTNSSGVTYGLEIRVVDEAGNDSDAVKVENPPTEIKTGSVVRITLEGTGVDAETKGFVVAVATGNAAIEPASARRAFVTGPEAATPALEPLVSKWSTTSYRGVAAKNHNDVLPLKGASDCPAGSERVEVGGISTPNGGGSRVLAKCTKEDVYAGTVGMQLTFDGLRHQTGDYTGTIDLLPTDEDKGTVELTVRRTDTIVLPTFFLAVGIGLAVLVGAWVGRRNTISEDVEDAWRLLGDGEDAQRAFAQKAGDEPWKFYNFQPALRTTVMETIDGLRQLGHLYSKMAADDAERDRLRAQLDDPRKLVKLWPHLAEQLEELPSLLDRVREEAKKYNHDPRLPRFLEWAQSLLLGRSGLTVAEALDVADHVDQATSMAKVWPGWVAEAVQCGKDLDLIKIAVTGRGIPSDHHDFTVLAQTKGKLSEVVSELWSAENATDLADRETEKDLETARAMVNSLRHHISAPLVPAGSTPTDELGQRAAAAVSSVRRALESASTPAEEAAAEAKKRRKRNMMVLCILAIVALWAGLVANYFDKPFGTPRDYLTILVWGFAAQTTLEALAAAADRLRSKLASP